MPIWRGWGHNLSAWPVPSATSRSVLHTVPHISLCPPESPWQQAQVLLNLKVSRRLSTPLTGCLPQDWKLKGGGGRGVVSMCEKVYQQVREAEAQRKLWCGVGVSKECVWAGVPTANPTIRCQNSYLPNCDLLVNKTILIFHLRLRKMVSAFFF